jgi:hypothetical protein
MTACSQKPKAQQPAKQKAVSSKSGQIAQGTYICWQNSPTSHGGMRALGDMIVSGNNYGGGLYGKGKYSYDPPTKIVRFEGGGFDQRKTGQEWIGVFYQKGEEFLDGSGGKAANTMLIITTRSDWEGGLKKAWIQQCDLK